MNFDPKGEGFFNKLRVDQLLRFLCMRTRSSSNLVGESSPNPTTSNPKCRNHRRSKQHFSLEESPLDTRPNSLNSAAGGNLLERRTQDVLMIIENKSKVRNSRNKSIVSQVKSSDGNSSSFSEIAKFTHAVNQQTSVVTTVMTAILKQFQATPPPASIKAIEEICVTCDGPLPSNTIANPKGELKAITTRSGLVLDGPFVPMPHPFINPEDDECA
nr:hypothetical protein [Tanacetum cinerariifolium]GEW01348.1 hypothetical protein [Tanacetum cinerariifolium]